MGNGLTPQIQFLTNNADNFLGNVKHCHHLEKRKDDQRTHSDDASRTQDQFDNRVNLYCLQSFHKCKGQKVLHFFQIVF